MKMHIFKFSSWINLYNISIVIRSEDPSKNAVSFWCALIVDEKQLYECPSFISTLEK